MRLVIASNNSHKVNEMKAIFTGIYDEILSLSDAGIDIEVVEDGLTFAENALKKASEVFVLANADAVISDDSGLMVDALGGAPGVHSARYAGDGHDDAANNAKLLAAMENVADEKRTCCFVSAVALVRRGEKPIVCEGCVEGKLLREGRGHNGFGYDPLFLYEPYSLTFAELDGERKNSISHRANALNALIKALGEKS